MSNIYISTVTPVYRGAEFLRSLVEAIAAVREEAAERQLPVEIVEAIFVDDAAVDDSAEVLDSLQQEFAWVRVIHLSRNFGQHPATAAGILHASGDWIATLDEDLQHDPQQILLMLQHAIEERSDVVYAAPERGPHQSRYRDASSTAIKAFAGWIAGEDAIRSFNSFRLVRGCVGRAAAAVTTHDGYLDVVLTWFTKRISRVEIRAVDVRSTQGGRSGYTFSRLFMHAGRMLISAGIRPLRAASVVGALAIAASVAFALVMVYEHLRYPERMQLHGWASVVVLVSFFGGLTALLLGIALEYLSTVVLHILGKPTFFVVDRSRDEIMREFARRERPS